MHAGVDRGGRTCREVGLVVVTVHAVQYPQEFVAHETAHRITDAEDHHPAAQQALINPRFSLSGLQGETVSPECGGVDAGVGFHVPQKIVEGGQPGVVRRAGVEEVPLTDDPCRRAHKRETIGKEGRTGKRDRPLAVAAQVQCTGGEAGVGLQGVDQAADSVFSPRRIRHEQRKAVVVFGPDVPVGLFAENVVALLGRVGKHDVQVGLGHSLRPVLETTGTFRHQVFRNVVHLSSGA